MSILAPHFHDKGSHTQEGEGMYAAIRRGKANPGSVPEVARRIQESGGPLFPNLAGFVAYYFVNLGNDEWQSISVFETLEAAQETHGVAVDWAKQNLADLLPAPVQAGTGEVLIQIVQ
jgi:hypothetical protein